MKLIEQYGYNGCNAAGGPWEDVIVKGVISDEILHRIRQWCEDVQRRVAGMNPPRNPAEWRFTANPQYIHVPNGEFSITIQTLDNRWYVADYYGQGETYCLICEKEELA